MSIPVISPHQCIIALVVFVGWTLSSFLCHQCGKLFMDRLVQSAGGYDMGLYQFIAALVLTGMQCSACIVTFNIRTGKENNYRLILLGSHTLATMAVNYSMAYTEAASTLTIKLTEPVFMCVADMIVFKKRPSLHTVIAIPIIILGLLMFCGLSAANNSVLAGVLLAFVSNIVLTARNVTLKKLQGTDSTESTVSLRESKAKYLWCPLLFSVMAVCYSLQYKWTSVDLTLMCGVLLASCLFHVMYSYISTSLVLKVMDVVSHSVANIFKRLLVVVMLYGLGKRQATPWNFVGLCVTVAGLCLYVYDRHQTTTQHSGVTTGEAKRKCKMILGIVVTFSCIVVGGILLNERNNDTTNITTLIRQNTSINGNWNLDTQTKANENIIDFSTLNYFKDPFETNEDVKRMTQTYQVIEENQRILLNLLSNILGKTPYVMLMDIPSHKNKGDSAITVGEVMIIKKLRKRILFYCETYDCAQDRYLERAISISKKFSVNDIAILLHGGGNLVGYDSIDVLREKILNTFPEHKIVLLSQSIWLHDNYTEHLEFCSQVYSNRSNLSIFLRDKQSLAIAQENFKDVKLFLAPDMAFGIGQVPRMLPPYFDIVWLRRNDRESSKYEIPSFPRGVSIHISDWRSAWPSNEGKTDLDNAFNIAHAGFSFLQRGRIVITDRLHGHILSVLMDIPHVLIDNPPFYKLSSFDQTWTEGLENTVLVTNGSNALQEALLLLAKYNHTLPEIGPSDMHVNGIEISSFNKLI